MLRGRRRKVIRDLTISAPFPSRVGTDGRCHKCGDALLVGCSINNVGWLVSQGDLSRDLASGVEFFSQVASTILPSGVEAVSQISVGRSYHPWQGYVIQAKPLTEAAIIDVVVSMRVLDAYGELGASLSGPRG